MSKTRNKFSPEVRDRAVRVVGEYRDDYGSEWEAMPSIATFSYHEHHLRLANPGRRPSRAHSAEEMRGQIKEITGYRCNPDRKEFGLTSASIAFVGEGREAVPPPSAQRHGSKLRGKGCWSFPTVRLWSGSDVDQRQCDP